MAEGVNLFDLAAKISVDFSQGDKTLTVAQQRVLDLARKYDQAEKQISDSAKRMGVSRLSLVSALKAEEAQLKSAEGGAHKLAEAFRAVSSSAVIAEGPMGGVASRLRAMGTETTELGGLLGPGGIVVGGLLALSAGAVLAGKGIFDLVERASDAPNKLWDIHQKGGFAVETLSTLSNTAEASGSTIDSLLPSLVIFQKNLEAVREGDKGLSTAFKSLNVDITDSETALRSAFRSLAAMPEGYNKTAAAMRIFGRSGKDVLGVIQETNGDLDAARQRYSDLGTLIGTKAAKDAHSFAEEYKKVEKQLTAVEREIGMQLAPTVLNFLESVSGWLSDNRYAWEGWGATINGVILALTAPTSPLGGMLNMLSKINAYLGAAQSGPRVSVGDQSYALPPGVRPEDAYQMYAAQTGQDPESKRLEKFKNLAGVDLGLVGRSGRGGGRGGGTRSDPGLTLLRQLEEQFRNLTERTELQKIQDKLLEDQYKRTTDTIKKRIMITAIEIDQMKQAKADFDAFVKLVQDLGEKGEAGFKRLRYSTKDYAASLEDLVTIAGKASQAISEFGKTGGALLKSGGEKIDEDSFFGAFGKANAYDDLQARLEKHRERMLQLASDLTGTIRDSISAGFQQGVKAGIETFALGILRIVELEAWNALERRIAKILMGTQSKDEQDDEDSGGGGGGISGLFKFIVPLIGGLFGGHGSSGGKGGSFNVGGKASGGPIEAFMPYIVHKDELIVPTSNGYVFNRQETARMMGGGGQVIPSSDRNGRAIHVTQHFHFYNAPTGQISRDTEYQVKRKMALAVQQALLKG